jgi:hypothetical protein
MRTPASDPIDDRLRELLAVEQRLQTRVAQAREDIARRVAGARADAARRLSEADLALAAAGEAEARADREVHEAALAQAAADHDDAMARLAAIQGRDIDRLARTVLDRLRADVGGTP